MQKHTVEDILNESDDSPLDGLLISSANQSNNSKPKTAADEF